MKRYQFHVIRDWDDKILSADVEESPEGFFVKYEDVERLISKNEELDKQVELLRFFESHKKPVSEIVVKITPDTSQLEKEIERLTDVVIDKIRRLHRVN